MACKIACTFLHIWRQFVSSVDAYFCIGAQSEVYQECVGLLVGYAKAKNNNDDDNNSAAAKDPGARTGGKKRRRE